MCVLQEWAYDEEHELILAGLLCLDMSEIRSSDPPRLMKCHGSGGSQQWTLGVRNLPITVFYLMYPLYTKAATTSYFDYQVIF